MKKKTRESVFTFARNRCSRSLGIGVHVRSESVFTFSRNRCSRSVGIGVHVQSEYATTRNKAVKFLDPLRQEGYNSLEFYEGEDVSISFTPEDVPNIDGSDLPEVIPQNVHTSRIQTTVRIRKAAYEGSSMWTVVYKQAIEVTIDDKEWLERFQAGLEPAPSGSSLKVELEETYIKNEDGEIVGKPSYKVLEVLGVELPKKQQSFEFKDD